MAEAKLRNPFKKKALTGSPAVIDAMGQGWAPWPLIGGGSRQRIMDIYNRAQSANYAWMYSNSPAVRTVIDVIVRNVGQLDLRLYEEVSESERTPQPDHPAALSLRYPNERTPSDKFIRELFKDFLIHDNAYSALAEAAGNQVTFARLPAFMVEVQGSSLWQVDNYRVWPQGAWTSAGSWGGGGSWVDFSPDQVLHWHGENPLDPRIGLSLLDTIRDVVAEDAALQQATVELANNGLQEPTWIYRPLDAPAWSTAARRAHEEDVANRMRERNKKPLQMEEGMEMRSFGMSPRDAQMYEIRRWAIERVSSLYGVPLGMVGMGTGLIADDRQEFLTDCLPPYCEAFTKMLNQRLLVQAYGQTDLCFEFNLDEKSINADERLKTLTSATGRPVMLTNEARAKLNLPPVEDGDELVTPLNVIVGEKPSPQIMPIQDPNKPAQDGSYRTDQPPPPQAPKTLAKAADESVRLLQLHPRKAADIERQRRNIDAFKGVVQKHFNRLERSLKQKASTDWERWNREFADDINRQLKQTVQAEGDIYSLKLAAGNFNMGEVQHYLQAMAEEAATAINDTIRGEIKDLGFDAAMNLAPQHVSSAGTSLGARSTIWAREEAARQSGTFQERVKTWIADTDRHAEFDGDTVALGDDWPAGFAPGSPPNCACSMSIS
jgi:HK97 family phage portal protein